MYSPLVEVLRERGWRLQQMPCPELAFTGLHRFWAVSEQLDTTAYRRHCRRLAAAVAGAIEVHVRAGDDVILVGLEGSPSMGVHVTSSDPGPRRPAGMAGGNGRALARERHLHRGAEAELAARGVPLPRATGITHQLPGHDPAPSGARRRRADRARGWLSEWTPTRAATGSR